MQKLTILPIIMLLFCFTSRATVDAATPTQVAAAAQAAPHAIDIVGEVARVPFAAAEVLYLPVGAGEIVLSPLPGIGVASGVSHVGKGLLAPIKVGILALKLPFRLLEETANMGNPPTTETGTRKGKR